MIALTLAAATMAGCSSSSESNSTAASGSSETVDAGAVASTDDGGKTIVRIGVAGAPTTLDPFTGDSSFALHNIYETLCAWNSFGSDGEFLGIGAKSWECISDDGCTYEFELYDNIYDSLGNHITADDILFWYETAYQSSNDAAMNLAGPPEIIDDTHFTITLIANRVGLFESVAGMITLVSRDSYESQNFSKNPVTTAQYEVVDFEPGSSLVLELRDDYWQTDESAIMYDTNIDVIKYSFIPEAAQLSIALETGDIDVATSVSTTEVARFMEGGSQAGNYNVSSVDGHVVYCILPNMDPNNGIFADNLALRKAVYTAIDSDTVMDACLDGYGTVLTNFSSPAYPDWLDEWNDNAYFDYDVDLAKEYLAEAGYSEGELSMTIGAVGSGYSQTVAEVVQYNLSEIGINSSIEMIDSAMWDTYKRDTTEWDLIVETKGDSMYGINVNRVVFDLEQNGGTTANFFVDETLQELLNDCLLHGMDGLTPENLNAYFDYLNDNAYGYALFTTRDFFVADKGIEVYTDSQDLIVAPQCNYSADFLANHVTYDY